MPRSTSQPAPTSGAEILGRIKPRRRVERTTVCLRADLISEFETQDAELLRLRTQASGNGNRLATGSADTPAVKKQARVVRKIEDEIVASQTEFVFEQLSKDEFSAMLASLPPRKGNQFDAAVGYDRDAALDQLVRECLIEPVFEDCNGCVDPDCDVAGCTKHDTCPHEDCGTWQQLIEYISPTEWSELRDTANRANAGVVDPPKSALASLILDKRASASK